MIKLDKLRDNDIEKEVEDDLVGRDSNSKQELLEFYYKIVVDPHTKYKSFRYIYAKIAIITICNNIGDNNTLRNFEVFDEQKKAADKRNPVKKRNSNTNTRNQASNSSVKGNTASRNKSVDVSFGL